jgi:hypothetical protein
MKRNPFRGRFFSGHSDSETSRNVYCMETIYLTYGLDQKNSSSDQTVVR